MQLPIRIILLVGLMAVTASVSAQLLADIRHSIKMEAEVVANPPSITLSWIEDEQVAEYELYRRDYPNGEWGSSLATYLPGINEFQDIDVEVDRLYEYRLVKTNLDFDSLGYGYVLSGIEMAPNHFSGEQLLVMTASTQAAIADVVLEYRQCLETDGWRTRELIVPNEATVREVKNLITTAYDQLSFKAVLILGDVPIPHSGNYTADGHTNHIGAWSADVYYADLDGEWTDTEVNNTSSANSRNHNVPGDERWDQSRIPSDVEFAIGRVDFSEMPVFEEDENELLRQYLTKDMAYRRGLMPIRQRAMVKAVNPWNGGLAQNGLRFSPLVSPDSISFGEWASVFSNAYLWYNGASSGNYAVGYLMGTSEYFATHDFQAVFTAWFGSYFGDYDYPNAYMRSHLGSGTVLCSVWAGAPHWYFHPMAMGFSLGTATIATQNNNTLYNTGNNPQGVHTNLLGDPSLKAYVFAGPRNLVANSGTGFIDLSWTAPNDPVNGYYLYRRTTDMDAFEYLSVIEGDCLNYRDDCLAVELEYQYLLRAFRLETTPSGSFYNLSTGEVVETILNAEAIAISSFEVSSLEEDLIHLISSSTNADSLLWLFPDGSSTSGEEVSYELSEGENLIQLVAINHCGQDTSEQSFVISATNELDILEVDIFPNPVQERLSIRWSAPTFASVKLISLQGRIVAKWRVQGEQSIDLFLDALPQVAYFLLIESDGGLILTKKIVLN